MTDQTNQTPLYATLLYDVRRKLDISFSDYVYLDMVYKLSYNRWCTKSLDNIAYDLGMTKHGVIKMRDRLMARGFLKRNSSGGLRVTKAFTEVACNSVTRPVNSVTSRGELSYMKTGGQNNNRKTRELGGVVDNSNGAGRQARGYADAVREDERLAQRAYKAKERRGSFGTVSESLHARTTASITPVPGATLTPEPAAVIAGPGYATFKRNMQQLQLRKTR